MKSEDPLKRISYWMKLKSGEEHDLAVFLTSFEELNELDWHTLVEDLVLDSPRAYGIFKPSHGHSLLETATVYARQLSFRMQQRWARGVEALMAENRNSPGYADLLLQTLYFASMLREAFSASVLIDLMRDRTLPVDIRVKAARALANQQEAVSVSYWAEVSLTAFPELASALVSALATRQPVVALERLRELPDAPSDTGSLEYPLRFAIRSLLSRSYGEAVIVNSILDSPLWLAELLQEILALDEFKSDYDSVRRSLALHPASLDEVDAAVYLLKQYCSGKVQILPWEINAAVARDLGLPWRESWTMSDSVFDDACRRLVAQWQHRMLEDDSFSRRLLALAKRRLDPDEATRLVHLKDLLREDSEFDAGFSELIRNVEQQSLAQEYEDAHR